MARFIAPRPLTLRQPKARNPLVAPSLQRLAGRHSDGKARQQSTRDLREQLRQLDSP